MNLLFFSVQTHQGESAQLRANIDAEQTNDSWQVALATLFCSTIGILILPHASFWVVCTACYNEPEALHVTPNKVLWQKHNEPYPILIQISFLSPSLSPCVCVCVCSCVCCPLREPLSRAFCIWCAPHIITPSSPCVPKCRYLCFYYLWQVVHKAVWCEESRQLCAATKMRTSLCVWIETGRRPWP